MQQWTAQQILAQVASEVGLSRPASITDISVQNTQLLAALNSAGNELITVYPWAFLSEDWEFSTVEGQANYALPADWAYFSDQTQWDTTNHWPLLGPKSPQEWAWLRGGIVAPAPRMRYRVRDNQFQLWPVPAAPSGGSFTPFVLRMEYIKSNWLTTNDGIGDEPTYMVTRDGDVILFNPWLMIKYTKMKFYALKGFLDALKSATADFSRMFDSLTGKDVGAGLISMSPGRPPQFIGIGNVPDGNWNQ